MKTEEGIVLETDGRTACVRAGRHASCESCGACPGSGAPIVTVLNQTGARAGQRVAFELRGDQTLTGAVLIFILPLAVLFAGIWLGGLLFEKLFGSAVPGYLIGGAVFLAAAAAVVRLADKKLGIARGALPAIVKILE